MKQSLCTFGLNDKTTLKFYEYVYTETRILFIHLLEGFFTGITTIIHENPELIIVRCVSAAFPFDVWVLRRKCQTSSFTGNCPEFSRRLQ
jgi:hypothetical protein